MTNEINNKISYGKMYRMYGLIFIEYIIAIMLIGVNIYFIIPFTIVLILTIFCKTATDIKIYVNSFFIIAIVICVLLGKELVFFPQAKALLDYDKGLIYWFIEGHVHSVRLLIAYPGYLISQWLDIPLNTGFTYYSIIVFTLFLKNTFEIFERLIKVTENRTRQIFLMLIVLFAIFLVVAMNGRIIFAFYGLSIVTLLNVKLWQSEILNPLYILLYGLGILMSTVSSGTMVVVITASIAGIVMSKQISQIIKRVWVWIVIAICIPVFYWAGGYVMLMVNKNLNYFGGGVEGAINMLSHGIGKFLPINSAASVFILLCFAVILFITNMYGIYYIYNKDYEITPIIVTANISVYGLLFGYSVGSTVLLSAVIIAIYYFNTYFAIFTEKEQQN